MRIIGWALAPVLLVGLSGCAAVTSAVAPVVPVADVDAVADKLEEQFPPLADTVVSKCAGSGTVWTVSGTVHNPTPQPYHYTIQIGLDDKAGKLMDEVYATPLAAVPPGGNATWTTTSSGSPASVAACRLVSVTRSDP